jgi:GNAT superfamily N-acetyltransferase
VESSARPAIESNILIAPIENRAEMRRFIEFPYQLYRGDPYWVAPLRAEQKELFDTSKHPFWKRAEMRCFLAVSNGKVCGRVAAIDDHTHNRATGERLGTFAFYESIDSESVAHALLRSVKEWHSERGLTTLRGPLNPSINYECGILVDGFDSIPCTMMSYNPPYYARLLESTGLRKIKDLFAFRLHLNETYHARRARLDRAVRVLATPSIRIRPVRLDRLEAEVDLIWNLHNSAWRENWGASPFIREEIQYLARQLKAILIPDLALVAEIGDEPIAFGLCIPDINQALKHAKGSLFPSGFFKILYYKSKIRKLRVLALGVASEYRDSGVAAQLYARLVQRGLELGYNEAECSWVVEDNRAMLRSLDFLGAERYKTYRIYESSLDRSFP